MKKLSLLTAGLLCLSLHSNAAKPSDNFDVTLSGDQVTFIAATTSSCAGINAGVPDTSVEATYFQLPDMTVRWTDPKLPLTIEWVKFEINSPDVNNGTPFTCMIAGIDLLNTWIQNWNAISPTTGGPVCRNVSQAPQSVTLNRHSPVNPTCDVAAFTSSCPFSCGGLNMTNPHHSSSGKIGLTVYGVYTKGNQQVPVETKKTLSYQYEGI